MTNQLIRDLQADAGRKIAWDRFLDAYSAFLKDPSLFASADLRRAAERLETADTSFSAGKFILGIRQSCQRSAVSRM